MAVADLGRLAGKEGARHYYEYQERYMPKGQAAGGLLFQQSELARKPSDARILGWFQWELFRGKALGRPDIIRKTPAGEESTEDVLRGPIERLQSINLHIEIS